MVAAPRCGVQTTLGKPNSTFSLAGSASKTSSAAPATWPDLMASASAFSSTRPPRAQLMMRTPFFILAMRARVDDALGLLGQRRVQRDEVGAADQFVELDLLDADRHGALRRQERIEGDDPHLQADGAVGDDRADVAAADDAERLAVQLDAHELRLLPFAGLRRACRRLGIWRASANIMRNGVLGGGDRVAERRVHDDDALGRGGLDVDVVDADAGAADTFSLAAAASTFSVTLVAERMARPSYSPMIFSSSSLSQAELRRRRRCRDP